MPPGRHVLCVRSTRSSLGRAGRTAYRGYHPRLTPQRPPHTPRHTVINIPGYHPIGTLVITPGTARPSCACSSSTVPSQADTCAPGPTHYCTYGLSVPASRAVYAQCTYRRRRAACPQGSTYVYCTYVLGTRTRLGRVTCVPWRARRVLRLGDLPQPPAQRGRRGGGRRGGLVYRLIRIYCGVRFGKAVRYCVCVRAVEGTGVRSHVNAVCPRVPVCVSVTN